MLHEAQGCGLVRQFVVGHVFVFVVEGDHSQDDHVHEHEASKEEERVGLNILASD